jgi:hypothetical protein
LQISSGHSTQGTTSPLLGSVTFGSLRTVEGMVMAGQTHTGSLKDLHFPALTTIGTTADTTRRFYFLQLPDTRVIDFPSLTTINGSAEIGILPKLCTVNLTRVTRVTGNLTLQLIPNAPSSAFNPLRNGMPMSLTQNQIGCCSISDRLACDSFTNTSSCGCGG